MLRKPKSPFLIVNAFWLLIGYQCPQVHSETYRMKYNPNMFDDQYIGCSDKLEKYVMPQVLHKEKANKQFKEAWVNATEHWEEIKDDLTLPEGFEDEYGIALLTFTNTYPMGNPIHQQLNGNLTIAGASRRDYMEKFHFKALHFYLTRALQTLKPNCNVAYTTYRGSPHSYHVPPVFRFGRFTSSSLNFLAAEFFGTESLFQITTCFGARLGDLSFFPGEKEVLIPPTEKFLYETKHNSLYVLKSTGEMCSYFNCAYLEVEKREVAVCRSDMNEEPKDQNQTIMKEREMEERISALEDLISRNHQDIEDYRLKINEIVETMNNNKADISLLPAINKLKGQLQDLTRLINDFRKDKKKILDAVLRHQVLLTSLQEELRDLQDTNKDENQRTTTANTPIEMEKMINFLEDQINDSQLDIDDQQEQINEIVTTLYNNIEGKESLDDRVEVHILQEMIYGRYIEIPHSEEIVYVTPVPDQSITKWIVAIEDKALISINRFAKDDLNREVIFLLEKEEENQKLFLKHKNLLTSFNANLRDLQDLAKLIIPIRNRENTILDNVLHHRELLTSLQGEVRQLRGIFVALITFVVIVVSIILYKFRHQILNRTFSAPDIITLTGAAENAIITKRTVIITDSPQEYDP